MDLVIVSLLLALIPFINFILKYYFASKNGELQLFKSHITTYCFDWIFVFFNFLWLSVVNISLSKIFILLIISILVFITLNVIWIKAHRREKNKVYLFDINSGKIKPAGYVECLFFIIESVLIAGFIISTIKSGLVYIELIILLIFLLSCITGSIKIHGKISKFDLIMVTIGFIVIIGKVLFTIII